MGGGGVVEVWVDWVLMRVRVGCLPSSSLGCLLWGVRSMSENLYARTLLVRTNDRFGVPCRAYLEVPHASNMIISLIDWLRRMRKHLPPQDQGTRPQLQQKEKLR